MADENIKQRFKVVPDVLDEFQQSVDLQVVYGSSPVIDGGALRVEGTQEPPKVEATPLDASAKYTLLLTDPDAPDPANPTKREFLHWIVVNIPGSEGGEGKDLGKAGKQLVEYTGPAPPVGLHRYVFVLFKQQGDVSTEAPADRGNFKTRDFARQNNLQSVASVFFTAEKDAPSV